METTETHDIPASVSQRLLWMIKHYRPDYGALTCPVVCRITGPLDLGRLQRAVDALSARHDSLRTTFHGRGARLCQRVHAPRGESIRFDDLSSQDNPSAAADIALAAELRAPIDPEEWPALARLWRIGPTEHLFCLNLHHLVTDAWSTGILLRDLCDLYDGSAPESESDQSAGWSPADFVRWQRSLLAGDQLRRHQDYWRRQLAGARLPRLATSPPPASPPVSSAGIPNTDPAARLDPAERDAATRLGESGDGGGREVAEGEVEARGGARCDTVELSGDVVAGIRELARREQSTPFAVLLAVFYLQLHRVTAENDISVASMFANRTRPELRQTVGLLAGMVLLRAKISPEQSFAELVRHCHSTVLGAFTYSELPFQLLPSDLVDTGGGRADDVMFNVMTETRHLRTSGGVEFELVVPTDIGSRFPFELTVVPVGENGMRVALFRAPDRLDAAGGLSFLDGFAQLAAAGAAHPDGSVASLLTSQDRA